MLEEGWKPRVRTVKGRRYITLRKADKERSLGVYTPELWQKIKSLTVKLGKEPSKAISLTDERSAAIDLLEKRLSELERLMRERVEGLAEWKIQNCMHRRSRYGFTYCKAWKWNRKPSRLMEAFPEVKFKRMKPEGAKLWYASPHPSLCTACTRFMEVEPTTEQEFWGMYGNVGRLEASLNLLRESAEKRVREDYGCTHMDSDGRCKYWHWYNRNWSREQKEDSIMEKDKLIRVWRDNVKANPEICASCPNYKPRGAV